MTLRWNRSDTSALGPRDRYWVMDMAATVSRSGLSRPSARFQPTKSQVCTSALQHQMPPPSMRFTRQPWPQGDTTMVRPVYDRFTAPATLHHRPGRIPDRGALRSSRNLTLVTTIDQEI